MAARTAVSTAAWRTNEAVRVPRLDAEYFIGWARDIWSGDVLGRGGLLHGEPFLLNPLYAYLIAPLVGVFGATPVPVLVFQTLLAGATAALSAAAARRFAGAAAAWTAGLAVAFSASLVHLDGYVAVSGLAAFLVAGTCFACAPAETEGERGHGPLAAGLWLGLSALARPVVLFALPFVVWLYVRREPRKFRAAVLVLVPFAACAALSFARNVAVAGEPIVYTAANGLNVHLGNNEPARRLRTMATDQFLFNPTSMHDDAKFRVGAELGREPKRSEVSAWFTKLAVNEFFAHPVESSAWYAQKARWFFCPAEPASSADYDLDIVTTPALRLGFVPTWLVAALAVAGAFVRRDRRDLLLGPGALVLAHLAACVLAFPLSHYRSPAVPAMAVLAGCAVAAAIEGLRAGRGRPAAVAAVVAGGVAAASAVEPQPKYLTYALLANRAMGHRIAGDYEAAERDCLASLAIVPDFHGATRVLVDTYRASGRPELALPWARKLVEAQPWNPEFVVALARSELESGMKIEAVDRADAVVKRYDWSGPVHSDVGQFFLQAQDVPRATRELSRALDLGTMPPLWALQNAGLAPK